MRTTVTISFSAVDGPSEGAATVSDSIHADARSTFRVSARRFEQSPFQHRWLSDDTIMGVYAGRYYATNSGEDVERSYWDLRRAAVLYDVPERPVEISGPDVVRFLDHVFSRRVADMEEGRARYAIACTDRGRLFMDGVLFRLGQERFWYVQPDGALETWLLAHSPGFDVAVTDPHSRVLQIQGPTSLAILASATDGVLDDRLGYFRATFATIGGQEVYVSRTGWTGEMGFEVYTQGDATDADRVWDRLLEAGEPHGMTFGSLASMEIRRIEAGILDNGTDFDLTMTPFEAGLGAFVDLDKPAFIGRDALPRGFEVVCSKDGRMFDPDKIGQWDAFVFYTTGDLTKEGTDKQPAMSAEGEKALYEAVKSGKGFMGMHCATDTFAHHRGKGADDPYTQMIGGEFSGHGSQMFATIQVADGKFPGLSKYKLESFRIQDEWYGQKNLADDIHVVTYMVTDSMNKDGGNKQYDRPNYPQTWTRQHGKGRVFYTSMGHREDVWETPLYQDLLLGALDFITGKADGGTEANISKITPGYMKMTNEKA